MKNIAITVLFTIISYTQTNAQAFLSDYINLKNSLVSAQSDSAIYFAVKLTAGLKDVSRNNTDKTVAKSLQEAVRSAEQLSVTSDLEKQRTLFASISAGVYRLIKVLPAPKQNIYYQYCPMAGNGKGAYWLSETSAIRNPYFGNKMINCGSTKETISKK